MFKAVLLLNSLFVFHACSATDVARSVDVANRVGIVQNIALGVSQTANTVSPGGSPAVQPVSLGNASAISATPVAVDLRETSGTKQILKQHPNIAIAGYNIGSVISGTATSTSGGSLFSSSLGASATVELVASGVSEQLIQRVATAAHADLISRMKTAGINVIDGSQVNAARNSGPMQFASGSYSKELTADGGRKRIQVAGPNGIGYRGYYGIGKTTFGSSGSNKLSSELNAVIASPNLILDFVALQSKNQRFGNKANASGEVGFSIDPASSMTIHSYNGKGSGWLTYGIKSPVRINEKFAVVSEGQSQTNGLEQGLGSALGIGTRAKKTTVYNVTIDPARYEALAMKAAKSWNIAFVNQIKNQI